MSESLKEYARKLSERANECSIEDYDDECCRLIGDLFIEYARESQTIGDEYDFDELAKAMSDVFGFFNVYSDYVYHNYFGDEDWEVAAHEDGLLPW